MKNFYIIISDKILGLFSIFSWLTCVIEYWINSYNRLISIIESWRDNIEKEKWLELSYWWSWITWSNLEKVIINDWEIIKNLRERINELDCFENELIEYKIIYYKLEFIEYDEVFYENELKSMIKSIISLINIINCLLYSLLLYFNFFFALSAVINNHRFSLSNMHYVIISEESWRLII